MFGSKRIKTYLCTVELKKSLERKGYVSHRPKGRGFIYFPIVKQEEYGRTKLGGFVDRYFKHSYMELVSSLVAEEKVSEQELLDFLKELKENKHE